MGGTASWPPFLFLPATVVVAAAVAVVEGTRGIASPPSFASLEASLAGPAAADCLREMPLGRPSRPPLGLAAADEGGA